MSLRKSETLGRWTLLDTFCLHYWAWLLNTVAITPKSEDKRCPKVFNVPEFHFSEVYFFQNWYFTRSPSWNSPSSISSFGSILILNSLDFLNSLKSVFVLKSFLILFLFYRCLLVSWLDSVLRSILILASISSLFVKNCEAISNIRNNWKDIKKIIRN